MLYEVITGVGVRGGAEGMVHALNRLVADQQNNPDLVVVSLDFQNAFNTVDRNRLLERNNFV